MSRIPIGLELYSVRHDLEKDPLGTLKAVAEMGYEGVEFAGPPQHSGDALKAMLDEAGLVCCGWHTPFNLVSADALESTVELNRTVGNRYVIVPGIPANLRESREDWLKMADVFRELGHKLAPHNMMTGYHNHHIEFQPLDGECPWDTFFSNTGENVIMQLDLGNALRGGGDLLSILNKYPGRCQTIHLKPYSKAAGVEDPQAGYKPLIGEDDVPWQKIFDFCETRGNTQWYIVEYESDAYPSLEAVDRCLQALRRMGK